MPAELPEMLPYKRTKFATQLPTRYLYSASHYWMAAQEDGLWRAGLTTFGTRRLGELVDHAFEVAPGQLVREGRALGWIEGFKAISDVVCVLDGSLAQLNSALDEQITLVNADPYGAGWLYAVEGRPAANCLDVQGYVKVLDRAIDQLRRSRTRPRS
jgi:glycine cleavage system H protein